MRALKRDPAPSRMAFRVKRMWRSPGFRRFATVWAPVLLVVAALGWAATKEEWRTLAVAKYEDTREALSERPEFAIKRIQVRGASPEVAALVRAALADQVGASSMRTDAAVLRDRVSEIGWVHSVKVRLAAPETLLITVKERTARAVWRHGDALLLVDGNGAPIAPLDARSARPDLPLIAGVGADRAVREAGLILSEAGALAPRIRGLVRVGERRWDVILADGPRVMLPSKGAIDAMAYLLVIEARDDVTGRDVSQIDLRLMKRPTLRLNSDAVEALEAQRAPKPSGEDA